eukprot:gnl/TRDRNA2_/TRDRNA2_189979_c0_seq1.p3 gnl/TRDRNA2_/TRDRNA2_189979_c0~~gnl/TRDRNA2_/TRDRNA2_189979_c0_seq1.p3  ORF type:complete len:119 (-),score=28.54 gnl/TRDRNA2_/TRDRNA2_189979_c0_seq1:163-519(-)
MCILTASRSLHSSSVKVVHREVKFVRDLRANNTRPYYLGRDCSKNQREVLKRSKMHYKYVQAAKNKQQLMRRQAAAEARLIREQKEEALQHCDATRAVLIRQKHTTKAHCKTTTDMAA